MTKTWKISLDQHDTHTQRTFRHILSRLWEDYELLLDDLDDDATRALGLLVRAGYIARDRQTGYYHLGDRSLLGEPAEQGSSR